VRFLLDVNVLIALVDSAHLNHDAAHAWFGAGPDWATCPLTQNGLVRILGNPGYGTVDASAAEVVGYLRALCQHPRHEAIADDVSLADKSLFDAGLVTGSRAVTDTYLVGLAHRHNMRLATFDRRLSAAAVIGAGPETIQQIPQVA